jgi:hypothetical protein
MPKFTIGYSIHNKAHMIEEIVAGLANNISEEPIADYIFIFDGCTDDSEDIFDHFSKSLKGNVRKIKTDNIFQLRTNNLLMKEFNSDFLIIFQDDMVLKDRNMLNNILRIQNIYKDKLGIIGCRDGFEFGYKNMYGSPFSKSTRKILDIGNFMEKDIVNVGPIIVTKKLISLVGYFDKIYGVGGYEEMEYSLKCKHWHNLTNVVLGIDLIHSKFEHKNTKKVKHTDADALVAQLKKNGIIFCNRWKDVCEKKRMPRLTRLFKEMRKEYMRLKHWSRRYPTDEDAYLVELEKHSEIVRQCKLGVIEIGVLNGQTTKILAQANPAIPVYGIDPLIPDSMNEKLIGSEENIAKNMRGLENFYFIKDFSYNAVKWWDKPFDYLFIDGSHIYEDVKKDFEDWFPKLALSGFVSFHDSTMNRGGQPYWEGPSKCADELIRDPRVEYIASVGRLTIFRRKR